MTDSIMEAAEKIEQAAACLHEVKLKTNDVLIVQLEKHIPNSSLTRLGQTLKQVLGKQVVLLPPNTIDKIFVVSEDDKLTFEDFKME